MFRSTRQLSVALTLILAPGIVFLSGCPTVNVPADLLPCDDSGGTGNTDDTTQPPPPPPPPPVETTYSGQATVYRATIAGTETVRVDTGPLPAAGGILDASGLTVEVPNVLLAEIGHATTFAGNGISQSEAALAQIDLRVGTHKVQADYLMARATAKCSAPENGSAAVSGELIVSNLRIDDQVTTVTADPNQEVVLRDGAGQVVGRVVLNEQVSNVNGATGDITVNGLKIEVTGVATVVLFSAHADLSCATSKVGDDFITGGGFFQGINHNYFAVAGGTIGGAFKGHLAYKDTFTGMRVTGTGVTKYTVIDGTTRHIEGTCEVDGVAGFIYEVDVTDNGEPGTADRFLIHLSNGYQSAGQLQAGNIQLHAKGQ